MAVTIIRNLRKAARQFAAGPRTIDDLAAEGRYYRHPDAALVAYPRTVEDVNNNAIPIGTLDLSTNPRIGIIGGGAGGIAAAYELSRIAHQYAGTGTMQVTLFEADANNFLFENEATPPQLRNAGRVSSYKTANSETVYEIGAMRFPEIAGLTWHYAKVAFEGGQHQVNPFPNPGAVPTEFHFGTQHDRYGPDATGDQAWENPNSVTPIIRDLVGAGLDGGVYDIGGRAPSQVAEDLKNSATTDAALEVIHTQWQAFIREHEGTTLGAAVREILNRAGEAGSLPAVSGLQGGELVNWCVELFGRFGFGTGGFKPLFNISLVEMMRLILWDYSTEYTFPADMAESNVEFIKKLYQRSQEASPVHFSMTAVHAKVTNITRRIYAGGTGTPVNTIHYIPQNAPAAPQLLADDFDYVIIALPHDAAVPLVSRTGYGRSSQAVLVGDGSVSEFVPVEGAQRYFVPPLSLQSGPTELAANARVATAIASLNMTRSTKVFATVTNAAAQNAPLFHGQPISAVVSDSGLAATYMVPSTVAGNETNYRSFLVSYTWDNDSTRMQHTLANWPQETETALRPYMFNAMVSRTMRPDAFTSGESWWLLNLMEAAASNDRTSYDWTTHTSAGGFKLDQTGDHYQSNLCFRYHTVALRAAQGDRELGGVFLAGCSFSHLGGWLEGAFMTAINAVAGIVVSANNGSTSTLNPEAQKLFASYLEIGAQPAHGTKKGHKPH